MPKESTSLHSSQRRGLRYDHAECWTNTLLPQQDLSYASPTVLPQLDVAFSNPSRHTLALCYLISHALYYPSRTQPLLLQLYTPPAGHTLNYFSLPTLFYPSGYTPFSNPAGHAGWTHPHPLGICYSSLTCPLLPVLGTSSADQAGYNLSWTHSLLHQLYIPSANPAGPTTHPVLFQLDTPSTTPARQVCYPLAASPIIVKLNNKLLHLFRCFTTN